MAKLAAGQALVSRGEVKVHFRTAYVRSSRHTSHACMTHVRQKREDGKEEVDANMQSSIKA